MFWEETGCLLDSPGMPAGHGVVWPPRRRAGRRWVGRCAGHLPSGSHGLGSGGQEEIAGSISSLQGH